MKIKLLIISLLFLIHPGVFLATDSSQKIDIVDNQVVIKKCCHCGPIEHVFYKLCVKNYNKIFAVTGLLENNDFENLSTNIVEALQMLVQTIKFVDAQGDAIVPTLNSKGKLTLPMSKNQDYIMLKEILAKVDIATTVSAEELFQEWLEKLQVMKKSLV